MALSCPTLTWHMRLVSTSHWQDMFLQIDRHCDGSTVMVAGLCILSL